MNIVLLNTIMIAITTCCCDKEHFTVTTTAGLLTSLQDYFLNGCVFLLFSEYQTKTNPSPNILKNLSKLLSREYIQVAQVSFQSFNHTVTGFNTSNNHPLNVILTTEADVRDHLNQLSQTTILKGPIWLLFMDNDTSPQEFLADVNIPFDCEFLIAHPDDDGIILTEVYRIIAGGSLLTSHFGHWTSDGDFDFSQVDFYRRRSSLQGLTISAATIENPPITTLTLVNNHVAVKGYFGEIWSLLEKLMNFTTNYSFPLDGARGSVMDNGTADGMIKMIQDEAVHVAVDAFGMSAIRATIVDFTVPLQSTRYCVLIKAPDNVQLQWNNFLAPFNVMVWMVMVATVLIIAIHLTLLYSLGRRFGNPEAEDIKFYTFSDSLLLVLGIFCQQGHESTPKSYSCRFVFISAYILAVMIFGTYSATFISFLTIHNEKLPYTDLKNLLLKGGYTFGVSSKHAQNYISEASRHFLKKQFNGTYVSNVQPLVLKGIQQVCSSKHAYLMPYDTALAFKNRVRCTIVPLPEETSLSIPQGMAITKHSPYIGIINYNLNILRANGVLFKHRVFDTVRKFPKDKRSNWTAVCLEDIAPIISFLMVGVVASVILLLLERSTPKRLMTMEQRGGVFCFISAVRHNKATEINKRSANNLTTVYQPDDDRKFLDFSENYIHQVQENSSPEFENSNSRPIHHLV